MRLRSFVTAALATALAAAHSRQWHQPRRPPPTAGGFAYVKDPTVPVWTVLDTSRQWGSWKTAFPAAWADGVKLAPGRFQVRFPQVGAGSRGVPHVTPVNRTGHYCEVVRWFQSGADEIVDVQCHDPAAPATTPRSPCSGRPVRARRRPAPPTRTCSGRRRGGAVVQLPRARRTQARAGPNASSRVCIRSGLLWRRYPRSVAGGFVRVMVSSIGGAGMLQAGVTCGGPAGRLAAGGAGRFEVMGSAHQDGRPSGNSSVVRDRAAQRS